MGDREKKVIRGVGLAVFIATLWAIATGSAAGQARTEFNMLVVGDSHIGGQGLKEKNRFYSLVRDSLERGDVFGSRRTVNLNLKAHGGSRLNLHSDELARMQEAGDDVTKYYYHEANISQPSIRQQIDDARQEYSSGSDVDLVMLTGCITDVLVGNIVNPFVSKKRLRADIKLYCGEVMQGLLEHITATFPRAEVVVVGYFPIISSKTPLKKLPRYFLRIVNFPRSLDFVFTNVLCRQLMRPLRSKIAAKSKVWLHESDLAIMGAIDHVNSDLARARIHFVPSPITWDQSYGRPDTRLWEIGDDGTPNDETYKERKAGCKVVFDELKYQHYGRLSTRMCELSSVAHPNVEGARAFADAITNKLKSVY